MKTRYDKLVVVRAAASRAATAALVDATGQLAGQEALVRRLEGAAAALSPDKGLVPAADLAARLELAVRMQSARQVTQARIEDARIDRDGVAHARRTARRALDAAVDIRRAHNLAKIARAEAKAQPVKPKNLRS
jgi:hypothetical protein